MFVKNFFKNYSKTTIAIVFLIIAVLVVLNIYLFREIATKRNKSSTQDKTKSSQNSEEDSLYPAAPKVNSKTQRCVDSVYSNFEKEIVYVKIKDSIEMAKLLDSLGFKQQLTTTIGYTEVKTKKSYEEMEQIREKIKAKDPENFWPNSLITKDTQSISIQSRQEITVLEMKKFIELFEELEIDRIPLAQSNYDKTGSLGVKIYVNKGDEIKWMCYFKTLNPEIIEDALLNYIVEPQISDE